MSLFRIPSVQLLQTKESNYREAIKSLLSKHNPENEMLKILIAFLFIWHGNKKSSVGGGCDLVSVRRLHGGEYIANSKDSAEERAPRIRDLLHQQE